MLEFGPGEPWAGNLLYTLHFVLTSSPRGGRAQREWQGRPPRSPSRSLTLSLWQKPACHRGLWSTWGRAGNSKANARAKPPLEKHPGIRCIPGWPSLR